MRWLDGITNSIHMSLSTLQKVVKDRETSRAAPMGSQRIRDNLVTKIQQQTHPVPCTDSRQKPSASREETENKLLPNILKLYKAEDLSWGWEKKLPHTQNPPIQDPCHGGRRENPPVVIRRRKGFGLFS